MNNSRKYNRNSYQSVDKGSYSFSKDRKSSKDYNYSELLGLEVTSFDKVEDVNPFHLFGEFFTHFLTQKPTVFNSSDIEWEGILRILDYCEDQECVVSDSEAFQGVLRALQLH